MFTRKPEYAISQHTVSAYYQKDPWSTGHQSPQHHPCKQSHLLKTVALSQAYGKVTICRVPMGSLKTSGKMPSLLLLFPSISLPCQIPSDCALLCPYSVSDAHLACSCPMSAHHAQLLNCVDCLLFWQGASLVKTVGGRGLFSCLWNRCKEKNLITGDNPVI